MDAYKYRGALASFLGDRWWNESIGGWFWELAEGRSPSSERLRATLEARYDVKLPPSGVGSNAVLSYNDHLKPKGRLAAADNCRRIEPDDWPPFARYAYAEREDIEASLLLSLIASPEDNG
ncbi:hypothetical protein EON80_25095 [bacterium]|nr:MAG: hypothetical protein EON80_25095 [bacterium]